MKTLRALLVCFVIANAASLTGCATVRGDSSLAAKRSCTEDMNWAQKTGYYLWWPLQEMLYGIAAGNPSFSP